MKHAVSIALLVLLAFAAAHQFVERLEEDSQENSEEQTFARTELEMEVEADSTNLASASVAAPSPYGNLLISHRFNGNGPWFKTPNLPAGIKGSLNTPGDVLAPLHTYSVLDTFKNYAWPNGSYILTLVYPNKPAPNAITFRQTNNPTVGGCGNMQNDFSVIGSDNGWSFQGVKISCKAGRSLMDGDGTPWTNYWMIGAYNNPVFGPSGWNVDFYQLYAQPPPGVALQTPPPPTLAPAKTPIEKLTGAVTGTYQLMGCFADGGPASVHADLPDQLPITGKLTVELCVAMAIRKGYKYAAMQNGNSCYGGPSAGVFGASTVCRTPCDGNKAQICGGAWANSIYQVTGAAQVDCVLSAPVVSACSKACGGGTASSVQTIITAAQQGGAACPAQLTSTVACNPQPCPVDCKQSAWTPCVKGSPTQTRTVLQAPLNNGLACGPASQEVCPVDCVVTAWTSCVPGHTQQQRTILTAAANGGVACPALVQNTCKVNCQMSAWSACVPGSTLQTRTVVVAAANGGVPCPTDLSQNKCAVDCQMTAWKDVGACSAKCGPGVSTQTRAVIANPVNGGAACGPTTQTTPCNLGTCNTDCVQSPWSACVKGSALQTRTVITASAGNGKACGPNSQTTTCPVDCVVGPTTTSPCSKATGQIVTTRVIVTPSQNGGIACPPASSSVPCSQDCMLGPKQWVSTNLPVLNAYMRPTLPVAWIPQFNRAATALSAGACFAGCAFAIQPIARPQQGFGMDCPAWASTNPQTPQCTECVSNCAYSDWVADPCSSSGVQTLRRTVLAPYCVGPKNCDKLAGCKEPLTKTQTCPVDCQVSAWSGCDRTFKTAKVTRTVTVTPKNGGKACPALEQIGAGCRQDCQYAPVTWSACSTYCGKVPGFQYGQAKVIAPSLNGGTKCVCGGYDGMSRAPVRGQNNNMPMGGWGYHVPDNTLVATCDGTASGPVFQSFLQPCPTVPPACIIKSAEDLYPLLTNTATCRDPKNPKAVFKQACIDEMINKMKSRSVLPVSAQQHYFLPTNAQAGPEGHWNPAAQAASVARNMEGPWLQYKFACGAQLPRVNTGDLTATVAAHWNKGTTAACISAYNSFRVWYNQLTCSTAPQVDNFADPTAGGLTFVCKPFTF